MRKASVKHFDELRNKRRSVDLNMISGKNFAKHLEVFSKDKMRKWIKNAPKTINQTVTKPQLYIIYKLIANR